jgi:hypothetical protein
MQVVIAHLRTTLSKSEGLLRSIPYFLCDFEEDRMRELPYPQGAMRNLGHLKGILGGRKKV